MDTRYRFPIVFIILLICTLVALAEPEQVLAGIRLGMTKTEVKDRLGWPDGKMKPLPAFNKVLDTPEAVGAPKPPGGAGAPPPGDLQPVPNTLMFTNRLDDDSSVMIGEATIVENGASMGGGDMMAGAAAMGGVQPMAPAPMPAGGMMPGMPGGGFGEPAKKVNLPSWAYFVRALYLELNQEQLIYKINDYYSIGVTVTKQDGADEYVVTDIVICSFEPLRAGWDYKKSRALMTAPRKRDGATTKSTDYSAKTSQGLRIGSMLNDVLKYQGWSEFCYPFAAKLIEKKINKGTPSPEVPMETITFVRSGYTDTVTPIPNFYYKPSDAFGDRPAHISDGVNVLLSAGFTTNCLVLYPSDKVAYTLINFKVVRIQIGDGVLEPPLPPPPPKVKMPAPAAGGPGPGMPPGGPGVPPGGPPVNPGGGPGDVWF